MKFLKIMLFTLSIFFLNHSIAMERPMPDLVPWDDTDMAIPTQNTTNLPTNKRQKTKNSLLLGLFKYPIKNLQTVCLEALAHDVEKHVEKWGYEKCVPCVEQILKGMVYKPEFQELLLQYVDKNTQPVWKKIFKIKDYHEFCVYSGNFIAWVDSSEDIVYINNFPTSNYTDESDIKYVDTRFPDTIHTKTITTPSPINGLAISPKQNVIALNTKNQLYFFNIKYNQITIVPIKENITEFIFLPSGIVIVGTNQGNFISIEQDEHDTYSLIKCYQGHSEPIFLIKCAPNEEYFISLDSKKNIKLWSLKDKGSTHISLPVPDALRNVDLISRYDIFISPNSRYIAIEINNTIIFFDSITGKIQNITINNKETLKFIDNDNNYILESIIDSDKEGDINHLKLYKVAYDENQKSSCLRIFTLPKYLNLCVNTGENPPNISNFFLCQLEILDAYATDSIKFFSLEKLSLKQMLFKIAACSSSQEKLNLLLQDPLLKTFKRKHCGNRLKHFIKTRLKKLTKES